MTQKQMTPNAGSLKERAKRIKLLLLDVDGVLTDGRLWIGPEGELFKSFNVKDGLGLKRLLARGIEVALVTGRRSRAVQIRAQELGIVNVFQGVPNKRDVARQLRAKMGLEKAHVCAMGDDLPDLEMFAEAGLRVAVADAVKEVRDGADIITRRKGGRGAVREICEWILDLLP